MSPEQARGEVADLTPASDTWALGCVLYEALCARPAFDGDTAAAIIGRILTGAAPTAAGAPRAVQELVAATLQKPAAARPSNAGAFAADCERALRGERPVHRPPDSRRTVVAVVSVAIAIGAAALGWLAWGPSGSNAPPPAGVEAQRLASLGWSKRHDDPAAARRHLGDAVRLAPERHEWRIQLGMLRWAAADDVTEAIQTWEAVPRDSPHWTRARWLQGLAWTVVGLETGSAEDSGRAARCWEQATTGSQPEATWARAGIVRWRSRAEARELVGLPDDWSACALRGLIEIADKHHGSRAWHEAGIAAFTRTIDQGLPFPWAFLNRGVLWSRQGDHERALADFETTIARWPSLAAGYANRGRSRERRGDLAGARADYARALDRQPSPPFFVLRGTLRYKQGELAPALADFDAALAIDAAYVDAIRGRGSVLGAQGDTAGAMDHYARALTIDPDSADAHHDRAVLHDRLGEAELALAEFDAAIRLRPTFALAWNNRGLVRARLGDTAGAVADHTRAIALQPELRRAYYARARHRARANDLAGAAADYDAVLRLDPRSALALLGRGNVRRRQGDLDAALVDLRAAVEIDPVFARAWLALGQVHGKRSEWDAAIHAFERCLAASPDAQVEPLATKMLRESRQHAAAGRR